MVFVDIKSKQLLSKETVTNAIKPVTIKTGKDDELHVDPDSFVFRGI